MIKTYYILFFFLLGVSPIIGVAQDIRISLFYDQLTESFTFHCISDEYILLSDGTSLLNLVKGDIIHFQLKNGKISLSTITKNYGEHSSLLLKDRYYKGRFMIRSVYPSSEQRLYMGELGITIEHGALELINTFEFDQYIAGVVEAEAGPGAPAEFFKVQSVLCRTYAVKNWERHVEEGFNLCDDTHCQAFHGIVDENPTILNAVLSTHGQVVADNNYNLISAAYHSNSGGETQKAQDLWPGTHDYLLPIIDSFSGDQPGYRWTKKLSMEEWKNYLISRGIAIEGKTDDELLIQQDHRRIIFMIGNDSLRIPEVRQDFNLRSAFFSMRRSEEEVIFDGKGYGHGIGLSQEGAMQMARKGYSYQDILNFYYHDIQIRDLKELPTSNVPPAFR